MSVEPSNTGKMPGGEAPEKKGVDPTRPIGHGNPPAHSVIQPGECRNPAGKPKGTKNAKTVARAILDTCRVISDPQMQKVVAQFIAGDSREISNRELIMITQANKAITKADTQAATLILKTAGELQDDVNLIPPSTLRLDSVSEDEVAKARAKMLEEDL